MSDKKYQVEIPDADYFQDLISCQAACPVNTPAGSYVVAVSKGDYEKGYALARSNNPLVYSCARICAHPCEDACRRGVIDEPISICGLKRAVTDHHNLGLGHNPNISVASKREEKVAVIGAGPAGLSAAHDLSRFGYNVTIFESSPVPGGMMRLGIPVYRLPRDIIQLEVDALVNMGAEIKTNTALGKDFSIADLKSQGYKAIFLGIGAHKSRDLRIPGIALDGVVRAVDFLLNVNLGYKVDLGEKVVVVGGGNVAIDVARTVLRHDKDVSKMDEDEAKAELLRARSTLQELPEAGAEEEKEMHVAIDVARSAMRLGAKEIHLVCLEAAKGSRPDNSREEMPAHEWEILEAEEEGIIMHPSRGPNRIVGEGGKVTGLEVLTVKSVFDEAGRFNPSLAENTESILECDTVIMAIGQAPDLSFISEEDGIQASPRGTILADDNTLATTAPGVFAGGDAVYGPRLLIDAVSDGQKAARAIDRFLTGRDRIKKTRSMEVLESHLRFRDYDRIKRQKMPVLDVNKRVGISEVQLGFSDEDALAESKRCLECNIHTIFDGNKCILCGGCVDVCPEYCLKIVSLDKLGGDENLTKLIEARFGFSLRELDKNPDKEAMLKRGMAMIKNDERCIRCGLCYKRCPTGAITMEKLDISQEIEEVEATT